jgi:hypothetical protein
MILHRAIPISLLILLLLLVQPGISYPGSIVPHSETGFSDKTPGLATSGFWNGTHGTGALLGTITSVAHGEALPGGAPASFSLDGRYGGTNYMTPIENQQNCGSCWAFAAVGAMEIQYKVQTGSTTDLSEQNVLSCAGCDPSEWPTKDCTGMGGCGGNYLSDSLNYLKNSGTPDVACDAYTATASACGTGRCSDYLSRMYKVTDWSYISTAATTIKNYLYAGYPVMVWMNVYSHNPSQPGDFPWYDAVYWQANYYSHAYSDDVGEWGGGHFVVIVGYSGTAYWIVRNSWGAGGGDVNSGYGGYFYMTQDPTTGFFGDPSGGEAVVISNVKAPVKNGRITTNTGLSAYPSTAAVGSYVYVAWQDNTPVSGSGSAAEIWMRVSSNTGGSFGSAIRISTNTGSSMDPSVAASGSYVYVAWDDNTLVSGSGGSFEIWMRVSSNNGASFGSAIRITTNTGTSSLPSVAAVGSYVYVAWEDTTSVSGSGTAGEIWMRVSSNNGASFGSATRISSNAYWSENPSVAADGGYVYVAWDDRTPVSGSGTNPEIWMRVSSNNGASFGSAIRLTTNTGWSERASVAATGNYVYVAWDDDTPVTGSGTAFEVWMRVSSNYGTSFGSAIRMSSNAYNSLYPSVAFDGSNAYVAWEDSTPVSGSGSASEIWIRASSDNGASFGPTVRMTTNTGWSEEAAVAFSGGHICVAFHDNTSVAGSGSTYEVWLRTGI